MLFTLICIFNGLRKAKYCYFWLKNSRTDKVTKPERFAKIKGTQRLKWSIDVKLLRKQMVWGKLMNSHIHKSPLAHPHVVPNPSDFHFSSKDKKRYNWTNIQWGGFILMAFWPTLTLNKSCTFFPSDILGYFIKRDCWPKKTHLTLYPHIYDSFFWGTQKKIFSQVS